MDKSQAADYTIFSYKFSWISAAHFIS